MNLDNMGLAHYIEELNAQVDRNSVGRVVREGFDITIFDGENTYTGILPGKWRKSHTTVDLPHIGDWVTYSPSDDPGKLRIENVLPRYSTLKRTAPGGKTQVLAANVDFLFVMFGLDQEIQIPLLRRFVGLAEKTAVKPVVILNKIDKVENGSVPAEIIAEFPETQVLGISVKQGLGIKELQEVFRTGYSYAICGPSGAGKSSLVNFLLKEEAQMVGEVRERDAKGKHTTTHRELFVLKSGGVVIDTPGIRELNLEDNSESDRERFKAKEHRKKVRKNLE